MENKRNSKKVFWIVLLTLITVVITLALIIRTEKRLLRLVSKVEKRIPFKNKKNTVPIKVDF